MKVQSRSSWTPKKRSKPAALPWPSTVWSAKKVLGQLRSLGTQRNIEGLARYGIHAENVYGVSKPKLDELAKRIGRHHALAVALWDSRNHDARILAGLIADPLQV